MTEKRFTKTSKNGYWQIKDNQADYKETFDLTNPQLIVDRLNALHEENQAVKDVLIDLKKIDSYWDSALLQDYVDKIANILGVDLE